MRLITFKIPSTPNIGVLFIDNGCTQQELPRYHPILKGCQIDLDIQIDIFKDQINVDTPYLPFELIGDKIDADLVKTELEGIGDSLIRQKEIEERAERLLQDTLDKIAKATNNQVVEPIPLEQ